VFLKEIKVFQNNFLKFIENLSGGKLLFLNAFNQLINFIVM